jgi:hypothetical protein
MLFEMFGQTTQAISMFWKTRSRIVFQKNIIIDDGSAECLWLRFCIVNFSSNYHGQSQKHQQETNTDTTAWEVITLFK